MYYFESEIIIASKPRHPHVPDGEYDRPQIINLDILEAAIAQQAGFLPDKPDYHCNPDGGVVALCYGVALSDPQQMDSHLDQLKKILGNFGAQLPPMEAFEQSSTCHARLDYEARYQSDIDNNAPGF